MDRRVTHRSALAAATAWLMTPARNKAIDRAGLSVDAEASQEYRRLRECLEGLDPKERHSIREALRRRVLPLAEEAAPESPPVRVFTAVLLPPLGTIRA